MTENRTVKSIRNTSFGLIGMALNLVVQFITRSIFVVLLGKEYNGINGLFANILQVLNLAELGFAYAIAFALYKPLNSGDEKKISAIMNCLRKIYIIVALVVAISGAICVPLLQYLIKDDIASLPFNLTQIQIYFAIYLLNTVFSYLFTYKRTIITADQNSYIISNVDNISSITLQFVQIGLLLIWKNYYAFLAVMAIRTLLSNIIITVIADKKYPYLNQNRQEKLSKEDWHDIVKNVEAMFCHKFGSVAIFSTITIIISAFIGVEDTSKYANYILIVNGVNAVINIIFNSVTASIGNLCVNEDEKYQYVVFKRISYLSDFLAIFTVVCYMGLFNSFIPMWLQSSDYNFDFKTMAIISVCAMIGTLRTAVGTFKNAEGLFVKDWYKSIVEAIVGIGLGIALSYILGTFGIILGYTLSTLFIAVPIENIVLFKYGLKTNVVPQVLHLCIVFISGIVLGSLTYLICSLLPAGVLWLIIKALICVILSVGVFVLVTFKNGAFKYYLDIIKKIFLKLKRKTRKSAD